MIFQDPRAHINPVRRIGDFMTEALRTNLGVGRRRGTAARADMLGQVGIDDGGRPAAPVPARAVGRHAAAGDDRRRAADRAAAAAGRRADHRARRHHPGRGDGDPRRAAPRVRPGHAVHHPRPGAGRGDLRPDRGDVRRARSSRSRRSALLHDDPLHPYTAALAAARPDITATGARLRAIPGRPLSAFEAPPDECAFAPRCPHARDVCRAAVPELVEPGRRAVPVRAGRRAARAAGQAARGCLRPRRRLRRGRAGAGTGAPVLEVTGLRKEFGELVAVDDVSFAVPAGRSLAIVGESGSGKTTIARMIVGLERPTGGHDHAPAASDRSRPARSAQGPAAAGPRGPDRVPGPVHQPGPAADAPRHHRRGAAAAPRLARRPPPGPDRRADRPGRPGRRGSPAPCPGRCPAASASGSRSPARSRPSRGC